MIILVISALTLVAGVLVTGVVTFMHGGKINQRYSLYLMNLRVAMQALALLLVACALLLR